MLWVHHLHLKRSKCSFGAPSVAYLSHAISVNGVAMDSNKVDIVTTWLVPRLACGLHGLLSLVGYYRKFIHDFSIIAASLTRLLCKDSFTWSDEANVAF